MSTKYIYLCNSVWEVVSFEIVRTQANHVLASDTFRAIEIRGSSQFFEPDRIGTEAAGPCFHFFYYPTLILSFLAKARRPEKRRQHQTIWEKYLIDLCLPLLLSLYRSIRGKVMQWQIECEKKITRMREDNAQELSIIVFI